MREITVNVHHAHMSAECRSFLNDLRRFTGALDAFLHQNQIQFVLGMAPKLCCRDLWLYYLG